MLSKIGYGYNEKDNKVTIYNIFRLNKYHLNNFKLLLKDPQIFIVILFSIVLLRLVFYALIWVLISTIIFFIFIFSVNRYLKVNTRFPYKLYSGNAVTTLTLFVEIINYFVCYAWVCAYYLYLYGSKLFKLRVVFELVLFIVVGISPHIVEYVLHIVTIMSDILNTKVNKKKKYYYRTHIK
jgi:hypothetical protein